MPNSYVTFTGNGSNRTFSFAGIDDYLSTGYLKVYLNNSLVDPANYTIDTSGGNENVVFTVGYGAPAAGIVVKIARETPSTSAGFASNVVDFSDGSILTATDLDKGFKGLLHIVQEANDTGSGALGKTADGLKWDAQKYRITNGAAALESNDLVTKSQLDAAQVFGTAVSVPQAWAFTGNGSSTAFTLSPEANATDPNMFIVEVGGVLQRPNGATPDYEITAGKITFLTGAPGNGVGIRVRNFGVARSALSAIPNETITENYLAAGAVTNTKLGDNAVNARVLADNAVDAAAIASGAVVSGKLGSLAVATANIDDLAVTEAKLAAGAVTTTKLGALAVTNANLATGAVGATKIGTDVVLYENLNRSATGTVFAGSGTDRYLKVAANGVLSLDNLSNVPVGTTATGNINMNSFKLTSLGAAAANGQAIRFEQVQEAADLAAGYLLLTGKTVQKWVLVGNITSTGITDTTGVTSAFFVKTINTGINLYQVGVRPKVGFGTWVFAAVGTMSTSALNDVVKYGFTSAITSASTDAESAILSITGSGAAFSGNSIFIAVRTA